MAVSCLTLPFVLDEICSKNEEKNISALRKSVAEVGYWFNKVHGHFLVLSVFKI